MDKPGEGGVELEAGSYYGDSGGGALVPDD